MNKVKKLIESMPEDVDALIITEKMNRRYFSNFSSTAGAVVVTREKGYLLLDFRYYEMAKNKDDIGELELVCFSDLFHEMEEIFKKDSVENVALETAHTSIKQFEEYKNKLKNFNIMKTSWLDDEILKLRSIKTVQEVNKIKESQEVTDAAFAHILNFIGTNRTEKEVSREIENFILDNAESTSFPTIVVSGKNSSLPHGVPTDKKIEKGDFVTMDFGAVVDGYCSDMTRTVCVGSPSDFQKKLYQIVLNGQKIALDKIKEGLICNDVDALVREYFKKYGYDEEFGHGLGHGVGLEIHEDPYLNKICKTVLKPNMVVTVEPGIYINGQMGIRIEDMVVVQEDGILNLTKSSKELICV